MPLLCWQAKVLKVGFGPFSRFVQSLIDDADVGSKFPTEGRSSGDEERRGRGHGGGPSLDSRAAWFSSKSRSLVE